MFIIKYQEKGYATMYFGGDAKKTKTVTDKRYALAIGDGLFNDFKHLESDITTLEKIKVSPEAEQKYYDTWIKLNKIDC